MCIRDTLYSTVGVEAELLRLDFEDSSLGGEGGGGGDKASSHGSSSSSSIQGYARGSRGGGTGTARHEVDQYMLASTPTDPASLNRFLREHGVRLQEKSDGGGGTARTVEDLFVEVAEEGLSTLWIVSEMATSRQSFEQNRASQARQQQERVMQMLKVSSGEHLQGQRRGQLSENKDLTTDVGGISERSRSSSKNDLSAKEEIVWEGMSRGGGDIGSMAGLEGNSPTESVFLSLIHI